MILLGEGNKGWVILRLSTSCNFCTLSPRVTASIDESLEIFWSGTGTPKPGVMIFEYRRIRSSPFSGDTRIIFKTSASSPTSSLSSTTTFFRRAFLSVSEKFFLPVAYLSSMPSFLNKFDTFVSLLTVDSTDWLLAIPIFCTPPSPSYFELWADSFDP